ncbi:unnamed protein product [Lupinus luteus]|uniref:DUF4283 domain-containing protein n=1 Tax=Lupinus luteus TaxID=3873 RepID=A0AAV1Y5Z6_LUPLU
MLLLKGEKSHDVQNWISSNQQWVDEFLNSVRVWKQWEIAKERFVWIRCCGISTYVWLKDVFRLLVDSVGKFVKLEETTRRMNQLDVGFVLVSISSKKNIDVVQRVKVNEVVVEIYLLEVFSVVDENLTVVPCRPNEALKHSSLSDVGADHYENLCIGGLKLKNSIFKVGSISSGKGIHDDKDDSSRVDAKEDSKRIGNKGHRARKGSLLPLLYLKIPALRPMKLKKKKTGNEEPRQCKWGALPVEKSLGVHEAEVVNKDHHLGSYHQYSLEESNFIDSDHTIAKKVKR